LFQVDTAMPIVNSFKFVGKEVVLKENPEVDN
jgi:hypothetical protein